MTQPSSALHQVHAEPRFSLDILRSIRSEIDALSGFLQSDSEMEQIRNYAQIQKPSTGTVPARRAARCTAADTEAQLAKLVEILLREIVAVLAAGEAGHDQDHG
jgi:hypothetical protein